MFVVVWGMLGVLLLFVVGMCCMCFVLFSYVLVVVLLCVCCFCVVLLSLLSLCLSDGLLPAAFFCVMIYGGVILLGQVLSCSPFIVFICVFTSLCFAVVLLFFMFVVYAQGLVVLIVCTFGDFSTYIVVLCCFLFLLLSHVVVVCVAG